MSSHTPQSALGLAPCPHRATPEARARANPNLSIPPGGPPVNVCGVRSGNAAKALPEPPDALFDLPFDARPQRGTLPVAESGAAAGGEAAGLVATPRAQLQGGVGREVGLTAIGVPQHH